MKRTFGSAALSLGLLAVTATAQDLMHGVDLASPDMVSAEMTRGQVEVALARATRYAGRFHWKAIVQLGPFPARPFRRDSSRGPAHEACRRESRWSPTK